MIWPEPVPLLVTQVVIALLRSDELYCPSTNQVLLAVAGATNLQSGECCAA